MVALGHGHGGEDSRGAIGAENQIDLLAGEQALVERARDLGLRLVVEQKQFDRPPEKTALRVDMRDRYVADDLVNEPGLRQGTGERERLADAHRRTGGTRLCREGGRGKRGEDGAAADGQDRGGALLVCSSTIRRRCMRSSSSTERAGGHPPPAGILRSSPDIAARRRRRPRRLDLPFI